LRDISPLNPDHPDNDQRHRGQVKHEQDLAAAVGKE
jgi:hypothetical protein